MAAKARKVMKVTKVVKKRPATATGAKAPPSLKLRLRELLNPPQLRELLENGRSLVLVRHANTDRPPKGVPDLQRKLTDKGREQCQLAKESWFSKLGPYVALSSKAGRCKDTLRLLIGNKNAEIRELKSVYDSPKLLDDMFATLGYAPLSEYYAYARNVKPAFEENAATMIKELLDADEKAGRGLHIFSTGLCNAVVLCGHAVFTNACAAFCADQLGAPAKEKKALLGVNLGEAEGFVISMKGKTAHVKHVHTRKR